MSQVASLLMESVLPTYVGLNLAGWNEGTGFFIVLPTYVGLNLVV